MTGIVEVCVQIVSQVFGPTVCRQGVEWFRQSRRPMLTIFCLLIVVAMLGLIVVHSKGPGWLFRLIWVGCLISWIILMLGLRYYLNLEKLYYFDPKTGLQTLRQDTLSKLLSLSRDTETFQGGISLALLDIDNFKQYNEKFGREYTDGLLRGLALSLRNACRGVQRGGWEKPRSRADELYRYYELRGDEFLLVLFNVSLGIAVTCAVRRILETYYKSDEHSQILNVDNEPVPPLVLSCGVIQIEEGDDEVSLRERLDKALRKAKERKNEICGYDRRGHLYNSSEVFKAGCGEKG